MKLNQIIILSVILLTTALIYFRLKSNQGSEEEVMKTTIKELFVPVREVNNTIRPMEITSYGQISPIVEIDVAFEVQGRLIKGSQTLKPGVRFSQGQLLYSVDVEETRQTLSARRIQYANLVIGALADLELDYPQSLNKWTDFLNNIQPNQSLPELPTISSGKERMFLTSRNILAEYYNIKSLEERYRKYSYVAPWSGTVVEIISEPGSIINPGVKIARIARTGDFEVKVPITLSQIDLYKAKGMATFMDSKNNTLGTGKIIRISDVINQKTQSVDVYYSISPKKDAIIYNGMFVNATIHQISEESTMAIPRMAMKDNKVMILKDGQLHEKEVEPISSAPDTVFVKGLLNGEMVVLEQIQTLEKITKFKGINR